MKEMKERKLIIHTDSIQVIKLRIHGTNEGNERKETKKNNKRKPMKQKESPN
jgi:hypothetical protein